MKRVFCPVSSIHALVDASTVHLLRIRQHCMSPPRPCLPPGDVVLDGTSTLTLPAGSLQQLTRLFEQYLLSRSQQHGFLALPSHPADTASLLQLQFLFDVLQKTISLKVSWRSTWELTIKTFLVSMLVLL